MLALRLIIFCIASSTSLVQAHHSTAMYDDDGPIEISGIVTSIEWENPHAKILVTAQNRDEWSIELDPPILLEELGWQQDALRVGDTITIRGAPAKSGARMMRGLSAILIDGTELQSWSLFSSQR